VSLTLTTSMKNYSPLKEILRVQRAAERVGNRPCAKCGEEDPRCLKVKDGEVLCRNCCAALAPRRPPRRCFLCHKKAICEKHHIMGRRNHPRWVSPVCLNCHSKLNDAQRNWPEWALSDGEITLSQWKYIALLGVVEMRNLAVDWQTLRWIEEFLLWMVDCLYPGKRKRRGKERRAEFLSPLTFYLSPLIHGGIGHGPPNANDTG